MKIKLKLEVSKLNDKSGKSAVEIGYVEFSRKSNSFIKPSENFVYVKSANPAGQIYELISKSDNVKSAKISYSSASKTYSLKVVMKSNSEEFRATFVNDGSDFYLKLGSLNKRKVYTLEIESVRGFEDLERDLEKDQAKVAPQNGGGGGGGGGGEPRQKQPEAFAVPPLKLIVQPQKLTDCSQLRKWLVNLRETSALNRKNFAENKKVIKAYGKEYLSKIKRYIKQNTPVWKRERPHLIDKWKVNIGIAERQTKEAIDDQKSQLKKSEDARKAFEKLAKKGCRHTPQGRKFRPNKKGSCPVSINYDVIGKKCGKRSAEYR